MGNLPQPLTFTASVIDAHGQPVAGALVTLTLSVPAAAPVSGDATTDGAGTAVFSTTIARDVVPGTIVATAIVTPGGSGQNARRPV